MCAALSFGMDSDEVMRECFELQETIPDPHTETGMCAIEFETALAKKVKEYADEHHSAVDTKISSPFLLLLP